jgi:formate hydrogenlyase subunit 3/multisubunit Na+/H+ antiporter MnhD subunit
LALSLAYLAVVVALASAVAALAADPARRAWVFTLSSWLLGLAGAAAAVAGAWALVGNLHLDDRLLLGLPWLHWHLRLDPLAGFFFMVVGIVVAAAGVYAPGYASEFARRGQSLAILGLFTGLFVAGMLLVVLANDAYAFMVAWELMSVSSYFLVIYHHTQPENRRAGFLYLLMAHIGAIAILLGFGVLAAFGDGFTFEAMRAAPLTPLWGSVAFVAVFLGFGMKAGMVPVHAWLPEAHPVAPSHISALMSGVMLKVALYGFIRVVFDLMGDILWQWGLTVLVVGTASALAGVLYAFMQNDIKRLLAYSSIENVGIILIGLGLSMVFIGDGQKVLGVLALIAALYHILNHALFKGLLFLGAGAIIHGSHEQNLNRMGGLIKRMPYTAAFFLVGTLAIAGLPPLNGFVSEWLTFQAALQAPALPSGVLRSLIPVAAAVLALVGALAAAVFVKVYGVAFLGAPRHPHAAKAQPTTTGMRIAMGALALACILSGILAAPVVAVLDTIPRELLGVGLVPAEAASWLWLTPVSPRIASYSAPLVLVGIALIALVGYLVLRQRRTVMRRGYPWDCGYGNLHARMEYSATAFAQPIRRIFAPAWDIDEKIQETAHPQQPLQPTGIRYELHIGDRSWPVLYEPVARWVLSIARRVGHLQAGSIHTYLTYSFVTLLVLLWVVS